MILKNFQRSMQWIEYRYKILFFCFLQNAFKKSIMFHESNLLLEWIFFCLIDIQYFKGAWIQCELKAFLKTLTSVILLIDYSMFIIYGQINVILVTFLTICYN